MTSQAKAYVAVVVTLGAAALVDALWKWTTSDSLAYLALLTLALLSATWKVQIPSTTSNISPAFIFCLVGVVEFSLGEAVLVAAATALLQSVWKRKQPVNWMQAAFNVAAMAISAAAAFSIAHWAIPAGLHALLLVAAITVYFLVDTSLVAGAISLTEERSFRAVWEECCLWAMPCFVVGGAFAGLICFGSQQMGLASSLLLLPAIYLAYFHFRLVIGRVRQGQNSASLRDLGPTQETARESRPGIAIN